MKNLRSCLVLALAGLVILGSAVLFTACGNSNRVAPSHELDGNTYVGDYAFQYHSDQWVIDMYFAEKGIYNKSDWEANQRDSVSDDVIHFVNGNVYGAYVTNGMTAYHVQGNKVRIGGGVYTIKNNDLFVDGEVVQEKIMFDGYEYVAVTISFYYRLVE